MFKEDDGLTWEIRRRWGKSEHGEEKVLSGEVWICCSSKTCSSSTNNHITNHIWMNGCGHIYSWNLYPYLSVSIGLYLSIYLSIYLYMFFVSNQWMWPCMHDPSRVSLYLSIYATFILTHSSWVVDLSTLIYMKQFWLKQEMFPSLII